MTHFVTKTQVQSPLFCNSTSLLRLSFLFFSCTIPPDIIPASPPHQDGADPQLANAEISVWTRPDCAGTPYENSNRTWFYFGVKGGRASHLLKINVMNLNRQAKLYSQGMHPVVKVGANGKWERAKDRPSYRVSSHFLFLLFSTLRSSTRDSL